MANPRRTSYSNTHNHQLPISDPTANSNPFQSQTPTTVLNSLKLFLKKPHAFPFLLSIFLFLTWVSLRLQHRPLSATTNTQQSGKDWKVKAHNPDDDRLANLVRFSPSSSVIIKDKRGWLLNPVSVALAAGISGGAVTCESVHVGEIRPGGIRGNHRHRSCNETFVIWGAKTLFRLENNAADKGYAEVIIGPDEVAVAASQHGSAHALVNVDPVRTIYFMGCQDNILNCNASSTDFKVWNDL